MLSGINSTSINIDFSLSKATNFLVIKRGECRPFLQSISYSLTFTVM